MSSRSQDRSESKPLLDARTRTEDQDARGRSDSRHRHTGSHVADSASPFRSPSRSPRPRSRAARSKLRHESRENGQQSQYRSPSERRPSDGPDEEEEDDEDDDEEPYISPLLILPLNFFNAFAWSLIEVPLIYLLRTRLCEDKFGDKPGSLPYESDKCRAQDIQIQVAGIRAGFQTIAAVLGVATTASYGVISDSRGRRHVMLTSSFLSLLGDLALLGIVMLPGYTNPKYVLISAVFKGLAGYVSAIVAAQNAFVADTTETDNRARYLGWNFATYHLGTAMGPLISGVLVSKYDRMDIVYGIGVGLWGLYFLYTLVLLPESNHDAVRRQRGRSGGDRRGSVSSMLSNQSAKESVVQTYGWFRRVVRNHLLEPLSVVLPRKVQADDGTERFDVMGGTQESRRHWDVCLAAVLIALTLFSNGSMGMLPLYTDYKLGWGSLQASLLMSVDSFSSALALTFAFPFIGWAFGRFLRAYGGASAALSDLTVRVAWLTPTDTDVTPSSFWPWSSQARAGSDPAGEADEERALSSPDRPRRAPLQSYGTSMSTPTEEEFAAKRITVVKRDLWVARLGYVIAMASSAGIALSRSASGLYTSVALQALANIAVPAVQSIALNGVRNTYNGRVLAGFALVESLALVARGPAFAGIYNATLALDSASVYWASVGVYGLCLLILVTVKLYRPLGDHSTVARRDEARQQRRHDRRVRRKRQSDSDADSPSSSDQASSASNSRAPSEPV